MLWRKMIRDILENKMAYLACIFVIAIGLLSYTAMSMAKDNLFMAKDRFYEEYHFADGFIQVKAYPATKVDSLREIDGIEAVNGRLIKDVRVIMPDSTENIYLRLISIDRPDGNQLNGIQLYTGSFPKEKQHQVLVADKFYEAHQLEVGQSLNVVIEGKQVELSISGSGQSPEYVYALKDLQSLTPDPKTFEVAYLPYEDMEALFNQTGLVNDLTFTLAPGVEFKDVEQPLESEMKPYGLESLYAAKDQMSNAMLSEELNSLEKSAGSIPVIFLSIAGIILYIMLKRLVESQRGQIGTMKAFGYGKWEILFHYLSYGLVIGLLGGIAGQLLGSVLAIYLTDYYETYFSLPNLVSQFSMKYFLIGISLATLFSLGASFQGVKGILKLQPAEAMHPPVPVFVSKSWVEKVPGFWRMFTVQGRMAIRNLVRNKSRSFFTFIGMIFTFSLMAAFFSMGSMAETMIMDQFTKVQKQDVKLSFSKPMPLNETVRELQHIEGVKLVEPMLEVPVSLRSLHYKEDVVALGIVPNSTLYNVFDKSGNQVEVPESGIMLSEQIADKLHVQVGDTLQFENSFDRDEKINITIEKIIPQYLGANVYMNQESLLDVLSQGEMATSALMAIDQKGIAELKDQYATSKYVSNIEIRQEMIDRYNQLMALTADTLSIMAVIAIITGFAIVYNSSIISLAERERELASLRVMGMTTKEVMTVISVEQWMIGIAGMITGIPLAITINQALSKSMSSDLYTLPGVTSPEAILQAFIGTILAIWISQLTVARKVKKLDLVAVLKERE